MRRPWRRRSAIWSVAVLGQLGAVLALGAGWTPVPAGSRAPMPVRAAGMGAMAMGRMVMPAAAGATNKPVLMLHRKVVKVSIHNFVFVPAKLVVSPGTRIIWTNTDSDPHTVDSTKNVWSSEALDTAGTFARVFSKLGTFPYYCSVHPFMHGQVTVQK